VPAAEEIDEEIFFASIGDMQDDDEVPEIAYATSVLVKSKTPDFITTLGDNLANEVDNYDSGVGQFYSDYIYPYTGDYGAGASENKFWPIPGNHDWDVNDLADYKSFFALPNNERYYELVRGPVHFFMLDVVAREPDGNTSTSIQAQWLKAKMILSPAVWKIVLLHYAPYTSKSGNKPGNLTVRWPFKDWGASLVLAGHAHVYERLIVNGLTYLVNGMSGATIGVFDPVPLAESVKRYSAKHGALFIRANCDTLTGEFYSVDDELIDTFELTH